MDGDGKPTGQFGFTLIELVVVLVILGILAATALPKFIGLRSDAQIAKMQGFVGAMHSAIALAVAKWQVAGQPASGIAIGGSTILFSNGYPTSATVGNLLQRPADNYNGVYTMNSGGATAFCDVEGGQTTCGSPPPLSGPDWLISEMKANFKYCAFIYYASTSSGAAYNIDPSYLTTENCS